MIERILKYPLENSYGNVIEMPEEAKILCVKTQYGKPTLWVVANLDNPLEKRTFILNETGSRVKNEIHKYIGTMLSKDGSYVLHCFEVISG